MKNIGGDTPTNGAVKIITNTMPYVVRVQLEGICDLLFHRWNCEFVDENAKSSNGSRSKKTDDIENFVYRDPNGFISIPSEHHRVV